jgi:hypothetical protein
LQAIKRRIADEGALPELVLAIAQQLVALHRRISARLSDDGPGALPSRPPAP